MSYNYDFATVFREIDPLIDGLMVTLQLTAVANLIGLTLGFAVALMVLSKWAVVRIPATLFVEFFRCTPAIIQTGTTTTAGLGTMQVAAVTASVNISLDPGVKRQGAALTFSAYRPKLPSDLRPAAP